MPAALVQWASHPDLYDRIVQAGVTPSFPPSGDPEIFSLADDSAGCGDRQRGGAGAACDEPPRRSCATGGDAGGSGPIVLVPD